MDKRYEDEKQNPNMQRPLQYTTEQQSQRAGIRGSDVAYDQSPKGQPEQDNQALRIKDGSTRISLDHYSKIISRLQSEQIELGRRLNLINWLLDNFTPSIANSIEKLKSLGYID